MYDVHTFQYKVQVTYTLYVTGRGKYNPRRSSPLAAGFTSDLGTFYNSLVLSPRPLLSFTHPFTMTEFVSSGGPLPHIPDNLTLTQFIFNSTHECRPVRPQGVPWLVEDATGRKIGLEEVTIVFLVHLYALSESLRRFKLGFLGWQMR